MLSRLGRVFTSSLTAAEEPMAVTKRRASSASAAAAAEPEVEEEVADMEEQEGDEEGGDEDENEEQEEEYEVDKILAHKQEAGIAKFLVSWKNYGSEHNTWEPEENINAPELLKQYWASAPRREATKKATKTSTTTKRKAPAAAPTSNKRKRGSAAASQAVQEPEETFEEDHEYSKSHVDQSTPYDNETNWEELVKSIETVERTEDGQLMAYMTMTGGERISIETTVCRERLPQKMLEFYESHLKWKSIEDN